MAMTNPQYDIDKGNFVANRMAAEKHKVEDFTVGEKVYIWLGTFAGSTTGVVDKITPGSPTVTIRFEDDNLPPSLETTHEIIPFELMHLGELKV